MLQAMQGPKGRNSQKCTYGFLGVSSFWALYGASRQLEVAKRIRAEHGVEKEDFIFYIF